MNFANALGFVGVGIVFAIAPTVAPGLFPHTAIDGSSTRALWVEVVGVAQIGLGFFLAIGRYAGQRLGRALVPASRAHSAEIEAEQVIVIERVACPEPEGSVVLHGEHAELWRAFSAALRGDGHARKLAAGLVEIAQLRVQAEDPEKLVAFQGSESTAVATDAVA